MLPKHIEGIIKNSHNWIKGNKETPKDNYKDSGKWVIKKNCSCSNSSIPSFYIICKCHTIRLP